MQRSMKSLCSKYRNEHVISLGENLKRNSLTLRSIGENGLWLGDGVEDCKLNVFLIVPICEGRVLICASVENVETEMPVASLQPNF